MSKVEEFSITIDALTMASSSQRPKRLAFDELKARQSEELNLLLAQQKAAVARLQLKHQEEERSIFKSLKRKRDDESHNETCSSTHVLVTEMNATFKTEPESSPPPVFNNSRTQSDIERVDRSTSRKSRSDTKRPKFVTRLNSVLTSKEVNNWWKSTKREYYMRISRP